MGMQISCGDSPKVPKESPVRSGKKGRREDHPSIVSSEGRGAYRRACNAGPHLPGVECSTEVHHSDGDGIPERKVSLPHTPPVTRSQARFHRETLLVPRLLRKPNRMDEETIRAYVRNQEELEKHEGLDFNKDD